MMNKKKKKIKLKKTQKRQKINLMLDYLLIQKQNMNYSKEISQMTTILKILI